MIFLWFKIMYYKITRVLRSGTGTDTVGSRARHEEISGKISVGIDPAAGEDGLILYGRQAGKSTATTARLRELIDKGLVHEPLPDLSDMIRTDLLHADREARETRALLTHDPRYCPCGGRHYPSADSCRWCQCHDPLGEHHGLMIALPAAWPRPIDPAEAEEHRREIIEASYRPCSVCGAPDHAGVKHEEVKLMDTRPSDEIVCCPACGHPQHGEGSGRCAFSVPSGDPSGGIELCRCVNGVILCGICTHAAHTGPCGAWTDDGVEHCGCES